MFRITGACAVMLACWQQALATSFKIESMGMMVKGNKENTTAIDHRRPITNVHSTVGRDHPGQLPHLPAQHHDGQTGPAKQLHFHWNQIF